MTSSFNAWQRLHAFIRISAAFLITLALHPANAQETPVLDANAAMTVNTGRVEARPFTRSITLNGTLSAWQEVIISPEVGGYRVEEVLVDVGDTVKAGQVLLRLSSALLETDRNVRAATLKQREAETVNADLALERAQDLASKQLLSDAELDRLKAEALGAQGRVEAAKADLEAARLRLNYTRVVAPDDGMIASRTVTVGQIAQAGSEMLRMIRQNRVEWRGEVPESMLPSLAVGQLVILTSVDGKQHTGTIRIVSPTVNSTTHSGLVYVDVPGDAALRPGMFARGLIELGNENAVLVPLTALISSDGYNYVFVLNADRTVSRQMIQTGSLQGNDIEVLSGVTTGAQIVTNGAGFLKDGDLVNVVEAR